MSTCRLAGLGPSRTTTLGLHRNEFLFAPGAHVEEAKKQINPLEYYGQQAATESFRQELSTFLGLEKSELTLGHGAEDLLLKLFTWYRGQTKDILIPGFSWGEYDRMARGLGYRVWNSPCHMPGQPLIGSHSDRKVGPSIDIQAMADALEQWQASRSTDDRIVVVLPTTNNPTGTRLDHGQVAALIDGFPQAFFILDAVYEPLPSPFFADFASHPRIHVIGSMSKFFGLPGLRLGFATGPCPQAFHLSLGFGAFQVAVARAALLDSPHYAAARASLTASAQGLARLRCNHLTVYPSEAPFILVQASEGLFQPGALEPLPSALIAGLRDCEDASGVWPKVFTEEGFLWFRFGLGADPITGQIRCFLEHWDTAFADNRLADALLHRAP